MKTLVLFLTTFGIIFLAELGDKTQLATMARSASSGNAKWVVFAAAASALVASTLVAVLFGELLTKLVPVWVIKLSAAVFFLVFGGFLLREALTERTTTEVAAARPNAVARAVLKLAADFERAAALDYRELATTTEDPHTRNLLLTLAAEEEEHMALIEKMATENKALALQSQEAELLPDRDAVLHDVSEDERPILEHAIEHELATAGYYEELARIVPVLALKQAFSELAAHERDHAQRLSDCIKQS